MTQYVINIGAIPNDGTGDPLRTAFNETNLNFNQVFAAGPVLSNIRIANNNIFTTNTNGNLVLNPNGIGVVQANAHVVPNLANIRNLGSATRRWSELYVQYANIAGSVDLTGTLGISGDLTVGGNLTVVGNTIQIGNITTETKTIQLANAASTANAATGSGVTVGVNDNIATMLYSSASNAWVFNIGLDTPNIVVNNISSDDSTFVTIQDGLDVQGSITAETLSVAGNITGNYFIGNGSQLTGINADSNKIFNGNSYANIATANGNVEISANGNAWTFGTDGTLTFPDNSGSSWPIASQRFGMGNIGAWLDGQWTIGEFSGNGVSGAVGIRIDPAIEGYTGMTFPGSESSNTQPVQIYSTNGGGIDLSTGSGGSWIFDSTGNLTLPDVANVSINYANGDPYGSSANTGNVTFSDQIVIGTGSNDGGGGLYLAPGPASIANSAVQYLRVRGGDYPTHIHLDTGNNAYYDQYFGDDGKFVKLEGTGNIVVNPQQDGGPTAQWTFSYDGVLNGPNIAASSNFVGTNLRTNLTDFNWSDPIVGITTGANTLIQLDNNVFGDPYSGQIVIEGVLGATEANGNWWYTATNSNEFELFSDAEGTPVDSTSWGAYTGGGLAYTLGYTNIEINAQNITIRSDHGDYNNKIWSFNRDGSTVFPTLTVNLHNGGDQTGQVLQLGDPAQQAIITGPTPAVDNNAQRLIIQGQRGLGTGEGGDVYLWAGDSENNGGDIKIYAGDADAGNIGDLGGYINIDGGAGYTRGGQVEISGGYSSSGDGGYVNLNGGYGNTGGNVGIQAGYGQAGPGGAVTIQGGGSNNGVTEYGNVGISAGASSWAFDNTGNLTLPQAGVVYETNIPFGGLSGKTIALKPYGGTDADQQLLVYPTAGADFNHLHLTSGNLYNTELFLGNDNLYVKLANTGNVVVNSNDNTGNTAQWTFGTNESLTLPGGSQLRPLGANLDIFAGTGSYVNLITSDESSYMGVGGAGGYVVTAGGTWDFNTNGNLTAPGNISAVGNITGGNIVTAGSGGDITLTGGNITGAGNISATGNITGNTAGYAIGYRDIPQVSFTGNATIATTDAGKHYYSTLSTGNVLTIANNASQGFQVGAAITIVNQGTGNITVAQGSGVTLYLAGNATSGNRTVATFGMATIMKVATDTWFINGTGVS